MRGEMHKNAHLPPPWSHLPISLKFHLPFIIVSQAAANLLKK